jgi:hypothetical protein
MDIPARRIGSIGYTGANKIFKNEIQEKDPVKGLIRKKRYHRHL